jgi:hypothetical protein
MSIAGSVNVPNPVLSKNTSRGRSGQVGDREHYRALRTAVLLETFHYLPGLSRADPPFVLHIESERAVTQPKLSIGRAFGSNRWKSGDDA